MDKRYPDRPVLTGQQIGLLGGPLYTTYKVLGAVRLARRIRSRAIYWQETNDADFNEINRIEYIDARGNLSKLIWDIHSGGYSVGYILVDRKLVSLVKEFFDSLRQTEFTPGLRRLALDAYKTGKTLAQASGDLARSLFGRFDIDVFDPRDSHFLKSSRDVLLREAERTRVGEQCNLFCMVEKKRVAVFRDRSGYRDRNGQPVDLSRYTLVPNVKTRNLIQDRFFNTHTYVAGPSEVQYIRELDDMYDFYGVSKPDIVKRMSAVLIEPKIRRILRKADIDIGQILDSDREDFLKKMTRRLSGFDHQAVTRAGDKLMKDFLAALKNLDLDIQTVRAPLQKALRDAIGKQRAQSKQLIEDSLKRIQSLFDHLKPGKKKQERVFNLFYFLNLYGGIDFIDWLYEHYDGGKEIVEINI
jgi:uncharacterized protein YllA (UPF0747 family)